MQARNDNVAKENKFIMTVKNRERSLRQVSLRIRAMPTNEMLIVRSLDLCPEFKVLIYELRSLTAVLQFKIMIVILNEVSRLQQILKVVNSDEFSVSEVNEGLFKCSVKTFRNGDC